MKVDVNSFERLLPYTVLDIKHTLFADYFVSKIFYLNIFYFKVNFTIIFGIKQLNKLWKKTFKSVMYIVYL